jgi:hypothetical protein
MAVNVGEQFIVFPNMCLDPCEKEIVSKITEALCQHDLSSHDSAYPTTKLSKAGQKASLSVLFAPNLTTSIINTDHVCPERARNRGTARNYYN